ncbi:MFS transporter [Thalassoroseus pseudoceratinae]|uniref:MFS transporter n=1 Tax=Thalassoroseus pseudoceratinae TaxID=2713176 RepID=UPI001421792C|nr:MFS transporter [Thalassoroseus pseudoceratinae]
MSSPISTSLRWRLSVLWALQWGITGSTLTYLPLYFTEHRVDAQQLGQLMAVAALGLLVAPLVVGQVCDRWMHSEKYLAIAHFLGGFTLTYIPEAARVYAETQDNFPVLLGLIAVYAAAYFPTIPLASSLTFRHLTDPDSQFGSIRIWGTVGWVLAGLGLSLWLGQREFSVWLYRAFPGGGVLFNEAGTVFDFLGSPSSDDAFDIAAILSFALSAFCVFLPKTPPLHVRTEKLSRAERKANRKKTRIRERFAVLSVLRLFLDPQVALLIAISFALALVVPTYSLAVPILLEHLGISAHWVPAVMTVGQISEFPCLALLHWCLARWGAKITFALGMLAWLVRYGLFAADTPFAVVMFGVSLHGVCHVFLVIVVQLYLDRRCPPDTKATAQNIFAFLTLGIALPLGFLLAGWWGRICRLTTPDMANFSLFFAVPAGIVAGLLLIFWTFTDTKLGLETKDDESPADTGD